MRELSVPLGERSLRGLRFFDDGVRWRGAPFMAPPQEESDSAHQSHTCTAVEQALSKAPVIDEKMGKNHGGHDGRISCLPDKT